MLFRSFSSSSSLYTIEVSNIPYTWIDTDFCDSQKLQAAFRDPTSPFYLAPGTEGPSHPGAGFVNPEQVYKPGSHEHRRDMHTSSADAQAATTREEEILTPEDEARTKLTDMGCVTDNCSVLLALS